ncbi:MAG: hypothetical protein ACJ0OQ_01485 [Candidatus Marisimplicoccus sp.]|jgi:hypothetical protein|tara:strand:+ start:1535 stop:1771 length:237 start_codon:yes stop_codon:yes gene_type:complete
MKKVLQILGIIALSLLILKLLAVLVISTIIIDEFSDGNYKINIIDSYQNKNYSDRVNINSERILIIKNNDTILDIESD